MTVTVTAPGMRVDPEAMPSPPDPEVSEKAKRRRFSAEYKLAILREVDACTEPGQIGALLRRERLYSSHLVDWPRQRDGGAPKALARTRGPQARRPGSAVLGDYHPDTLASMNNLAEVRRPPEERSRSLTFVSSTVVPLYRWDGWMMPPGPPERPGTRHILGGHDSKDGTAVGATASGHGGRLTGSSGWPAGVRPDPGSGRMVPRRRVGRSALRAAAPALTPTAATATGLTTIEASPRPSTVTASR
jgi:hypothetical protein